MDYKTAFNDVRQILLEWDPIGGKGMAMPDDEYDPEVARILVLCKRSTSFDEFVQGICKLMYDMMGFRMQPSQVRPHAERIWNRWHHS